MPTQDSEGLVDHDYSGRSFIIANTATSNPREIWSNPDLKSGVLDHCDREWGTDWVAVRIIQIDDPFNHSDLFNNSL
jgi:hypothetical protein